MYPVTETKTGPADGAGAHDLARWFAGAFVGTCRAAFRRGAVAAATILLVGQCMSASAAPGPSDLERRANEQLGLVASQAVSLVIDPTPGLTRDVVVPIDGEPRQLHLSPYSVRSPDHYQVVYQDTDGSYVAVQPGPVRTVRGSVVGQPGSVVAGSVGEDGLTALVVLPTGARWWIEPIASRVEGAAAGDHVVYREQDVIPTGGSCATEATRPLDSGEPPAEGFGCTTYPCVTELGIDTDFEFHSRWGVNTEDRVNVVINTMNIQYERDVDITHQITTIIVRTSPGLPYTGTDTNTLLFQLRNEWNTNQQGVVRDVAQLFTGKTLSGQAIGQAQGIGLICSISLAYSVVESDYGNNMATSTDLSAHELGHLWSAVHCSCLTWTMYSVLQSANRFHPTFTIPGIVAHRNSRPCLSNFEIPMTVFPVEDDFNAPEFDETMWAVAGAEIDDVGDGEPSPATSVHFNNSDVLTTLGMDATEGCDVTVRYWWQRSGMGGSPEPGEDLVVEFRTSDGFWLEIARHPGDGPDDEPYHFESIVLPGNAQHETLQVRWRMIDGESGDSFFVDDVRVGCPEASGPEIVHGTGQPGETRPFSGYVDPRIESTNGTDLDQGVTQVAVRFSQNVEHVGGGPLAPDSFIVTQTGGGTPPGVAAVDSSGMPLVVVTLDRPITLQEYTTLQAVVQSTTNPPQMIQSNGNQGPGVTEPDRVDIAFLPGDVDQSGAVTPFDLLAFRQIVNHVTNPTPGTDEDFVDTDRNGAVQPFDLLVFRQIINGIAPATRAWADETLNHPQP